MDRLVEMARLSLTEQVLRAVSESLRASGIAHLVVKGAATRYLLYKSPLERPATDIDIRVAPVDLSRTERTLAKLNHWRFRGAERAYENFQGAVRGVHIDVESHVFAPGFCDLSVAELIANAQRIDLPFVGAIPVPELHDHVLLTIVNAFKDKLYLASDHSLEDLARFPGVPGFDWRTLITRANQNALTTCARVVAFHMAQVRGAPIWAALLRSTTARRPLFELACRVSFAGAPNGVLARVVARLAGDHVGGHTMAMRTALRREFEVRRAGRSP